MIKFEDFELIRIRIISNSSNSWNSNSIRVESIRVEPISGPHLVRHERRLSVRRRLAQQRAHLDQHPFAATAAVGTAAARHQPAPRLRRDVHAVLVDERAEAVAVTF